MYNTIFRFLWRLFFIFLAGFMLFFVWDLQHQRTHDAYQTYSSQLGKKIATIAAGSLSPWLAQHATNESNARLPAEAQASLTQILDEYLALGDILGIRVFNKYGVTLAQTGAVNNLVDDLTPEHSHVKIYVSEIRDQEQVIGYLRMVVATEILAQEQQNSLQSQMNLAFFTALSGLVFGGLMTRWYYLHARRLAKEQRHN
jgi:uncharacterized membrane protein affecting hemolysin expression